MLVLSNGEKLNPVDFEKRVELHPLVKGAVVFGQNQFQTGALIEPTWDLTPSNGTSADILDKVWPQIEEANQALPKYGVVWKSMLAVATTDRPFVRTPSKGNIVRSKTIELYEQEIEALYANELSKNSKPLPPDASPSMVESALRNYAETLGLTTPSEIPSDQDLFALGMDSLQALQLTSIINRSIGGSISTTDVYKHPTIGSLAAHLMGKGQGSTSLTAPDRERVMADMTKLYALNMPRRDTIQPKKNVRDQSVLLTGSTGNLGCLLLQELMKSSRITRIYCLNRALDGKKRQTQQFLDRGLSADFSKVTFLHSKDFSEHNLGLSTPIYKDVVQSVDLIITNAWTVDFNKSLQSFEGLIAGTRKFVDLSIASRQQAHILMVSSVASVGDWASICSEEQGNHNLEVPERMIHNNKVPAPSGYGESKHVASLVLAAAAEAGVSSTVVRVGQLTGPADEHSQVKWSPQEWIPSLIATSRALGVLPDQLGGMDRLDWVPIDLAAKAIVDIAEMATGKKENPQVLHIVNPKTTTWTDLLPAVQACLVQQVGKDVPIVTYAQWIAKLREIPRTPSNAERVPGIKLLEFYEGIAATQGSLRLATTETMKLSSTMANLRSVHGQQMERWIRRMQWD